MFKSKFSRILLCALFATSAASLTACKKTSGGGGSRKGKSDRLRWVEKPTTGSKDGKIIKIPGLAVQFDIPDVLYVYKNCEEAGHSPEGPDKNWIPVLTCSSPFRGGGDSDSDSWDSEDDDSDSGSGGAELTIYVTDKADMLISERAVTSYTTQYRQAGFEVDQIQYFDEYLAKPGRRGIEILVHTLDSETGYPEREIRRFMFPRDDVLFIAHIDYPYGDDRSGINSDWERILWYFEFAEDLANSAE
ncbi:MAG: hypothetical protein KC457_25015 [Myxococcales bacterium]|nr:hypothetical protein [Myxococcales bacterium]